MQNKVKVLVAAVVIVALLTLTQMCTEVAVNPVYGETPEEIGNLLMDPDRSDIESFVSLTEIWTLDVIKYRVNIFDMPSVKSAQHAINDGYGDCSERAQVMHAILSSQGIQSTIIWGEVAGTNKRHAAVEVYYDGRTRIIGDTEGFRKRGNGLYPNEHLTD